MNIEEKTKNYFSQIRNRNKNDYKRKSHFKRINKRSIQYIRESVIDNYINKTNLQRYNLKEKLNKEK